MWTKRLEAGNYKLEKQDGYEELTAIDPASILEGTELRRRARLAAVMLHVIFLSDASI